MDGAAAPGAHAADAMCARERPIGAEARASREPVASIEIRGRPAWRDPHDRTSLGGQFVEVHSRDRQRAGCG
jgi:hypothetical protein